MTAHRPDAEELKVALAGAEEMRAQGNDPSHIALTLRYLYQRCHQFEALLQVTDRYLRFGMPEHELSEMRRLVGHLREDELAAEDSDEVDATLPL